MDVDESGVGAGDMIMDTETPPTEDTDTPPVPPSKRQRTTPQAGALSAICSPRRYKRLNPVLHGDGDGDVSLLMSRSAEQVYYDALDNNVLSCWAIGTSKSVFGEQIDHLEYVGDFIRTGDGLFGLIQKCHRNFPDVNTTWTVLMLSDSQELQTMNRCEIEPLLTNGEKWSGFSITLPMSQHPNTVMGTIVGSTTTDDVSTQWKVHNYVSFLRHLLT